MSILFTVNMSYVPYLLLLLVNKYADRYQFSEIEFSIPPIQEAEDNCDNSEISI